MSEKNYEVSELKEKALSTAKELLKETIEVATNKLTKHLEKNALFGIEVAKNMMEIVKDSIKAKNEQQKRYVEMCDKVIDSCNKALEDENISLEERIAIRDTIKEVMIRVDESNKQFQKDKKEIATTAIKYGTAGITFIGVVSIIATALTKTIKK